MNRAIRTTARSLAVLASVAVMALGLNAAHAKDVMRQNLMEIMQHSDSILVGTVVGKSDGFQQGLPYTEITVNVGQSILGTHSTTYTFRQFGLIKPKSVGNGRVNLMVTPAGWPTYAVGEQVMLFLHKPASETGFQTTAGLTQGKFVIRGDQIANGINNDALFADLRFDNSRLAQAQQDLVNQPGGAYAAEAFISLVRTAIQENWIENGVMSHEN